MVNRPHFRDLCSCGALLHVNAFIKSPSGIVLYLLQPRNQKGHHWPLIFLSQRYCEEKLSCSGGGCGRGFGVEGFCVVVSHAEIFCRGVSGKGVL